jgi:ubiquinone/menaquinone biosynthesis C-methylase UbiE
MLHREAEMPSETPNLRTSHHDWHSSSYVADWIARDVTRDDERRPLLRQMLAAAPFARAAAIDVLDVGAGYGIVTDEAMKFFPAARVVMQDYSRPMSDQARERLGKGAREPRYVLCDLTDPAWPKAVGGPFDLAVSAIAIHNLGDRAKIFACYRAIHDLLKPGGYFLNYDRFPGGTGPHLKALEESGFARVETTYEKPPIAIVVAGA